MTQRKYAATTDVPAVRSKAEIEAAVTRYGGDLFKGMFMTLQNLRGVLHRGVGA